MQIGPIFIRNIFSLNNFSFATLPLSPADEQRRAGLSGEGLRYIIHSLPQFPGPTTTNTIKFGSSKSQKHLKSKMFLTINLLRNKEMSF